MHGGGGGGLVLRWWWSGAEVMDIHIEHSALIKVCTYTVCFRQCYVNVSISGVGFIRPVYMTHHQEHMHAQLLPACFLHFHHIPAAGCALVVLLGRKQLMSFTL